MEPPFRWWPQAPQKSLLFYNLHVAQLIAIGPGVDSAITVIFIISSDVIHCFRSTHSCSISPIMAYPPPKANNPIFANVINNSNKILILYYFRSDTNSAPDFSYHRTRKGCPPPAFASQQFLPRQTGWTTAGKITNYLLCKAPADSKTPSVHSCQNNHPPFRSQMPVPLVHTRQCG